MKIPRTTRGALGAILLVSLAATSPGCGEDPSEEESAVDVCTSSYLIAQCPSASDPILGATAETECGLATSNLISDETGAVTASCAGTTECVVLCQFAAPCLCGVESVTREAVTCNACDPDQGCGNGVCDPGESPETCMADCGPECMPDEQQCGSEGMLRVCNLQGRFEALSCPVGQSCQELEGGADCDDDVVGPNNSNNSNNSNNTGPELPSGWELGPASYPGGGSVIGTADMRDLTRALPLPAALSAAPWFDFHPDGASIYRLDAGTWSIDRYPIDAVLDGVNGVFSTAEPLESEEPIDARLVTYQASPGHDHFVLAGVGLAHSGQMVDHRVYVVDVGAMRATRLALPMGWIPATPNAEATTFSEDGSTLAVLAQFGRDAFNNSPWVLGVALYAVSTGAVSVIPIASEAWPRQVALSPNGRLLLANGDIYDTATSEVVFTQPAMGLPHAGAQVQKTEFRPFLPLADRVVNPRGGVVDMATLRYDEALAGYGERAVNGGNSYALDRFAPDGNSVLRESAGEIEVWDVSRDRRVTSFPGPTVLHSFHSSGYALYSNMLLAP